MFERKKILVVGDVMVDRYVTGEVSRISPEAPVPVLCFERSEDRPGGAANVALNLQHLGMITAICSVTGDDQTARILESQLREAGIEDVAFYRTGDRPTTVKSRIMARGQHLLRVDHESDRALSKADEESFAGLFRNRFAGFHPDAVIIQDYNKGSLTAKVIGEILKTCADAGVPVAVDPKFLNFDMYRNVYLFKPNMVEAERALGTSLRDLPATHLVELAGKLRQRLACENLLITLSARGVLIINDRTAEIIPSRPRSIADVCGAGDTVISTAMAALLSGYSPFEAATAANLAGGMVCEHPGVVPVSLEELAKEWQDIKIC